MLFRLGDRPAEHPDTLQGYIRQLCSSKMAKEFSSITALQSFDFPFRITAILFYSLSWSLIPSLTNSIHPFTKHNFILLHCIYSFSPAGQYPYQHFIQNDEHDDHLHDSFLSRCG